MQKKQNVDLYNKYDDGLGGAYERVAIFHVLDRFCKLNNVKKILELNATFICGVPAFSSALLALAGYEVTILVHSRDYKDAVNIWKGAGLIDRVQIIEHNNDLHTNLESNSFDLVWNHLVIEQYDRPSPLELLLEMKRLSRKLVYTSTLNPYGVGYWIHNLVHKIGKKPWDHGSIKLMTISGMKEYFEKANLKIIDSNGVDNPPWLDTGDSMIQGSMTYVKNAVGKKWIWSILDPDIARYLPIRLLANIENNLPSWFKQLTAHHLYVLGEKKSD